MFKFLSSAYDNARIYAYNLLNYENKDNNGKIACRTVIDIEDTDIENNNNKVINDKQLRIDTLLFVRQFKNTYYKYTNKEKFNQELYNSFVHEEYFDGGITGFDDDDNIRIFDRYVLEYIKNRNDLITFLICKNKEVVIKTTLEQLNDIHTSQSHNIDIIFAIDMNEKDLFNYVYGIISKNGEISMIKNIVFSLICRYKGEYIRIKLSPYTSNKKNHPYLILESFLA